MNELAQNIQFPGGTLISGSWTPGSVSITGPADPRLNSLGALVTRLIPYAILFAGIAMLLMIIFAGFQLLTGASDPKQIESGKKRLTYGIAGFFVVFLAFWIVQFIGIVFGISEFACVFGNFGGLTCQ